MENDDSEKLASALGSIGPTENTPVQPQTEEVPGPSPAPPPTVEAFVAYRDRIAADTDGSIAAMMRSYADAQPPEIREKLENDVDTFNGVWDKFASAFPPRPAPPPPEAPPPEEYTIRPWELAAYERKARRTTDVIGPWNTLPPGVMPEPGTAERVEARRFNREVNEIRQAIRENPGKTDLEYRLAEKLFPDASKWRPGHGPEFW